jgi:hypothetical protein
MIVRLLFWRLGEADASFEQVRDLLDQLEPLESPSTWLWNDSHERFGALLVVEEDEITPPQLDQVRFLVGREPDLYEEFDALGGLERH